MRFLSTVTLLVCLAFAAMAQTELPDVKWGNTSTYTKVIFRDFLGEDDNGIYMLMVTELNPNSHKYYVEKYSPECNFVKRVEIPLSDDKDRTRFIEALYAKGKIQFLTAKWDDASKKRKLYRQEIDTKTMMKKGQPVVMMAVDPTSKMKATAGFYYVRRSLDKSKILVINEPAMNGETLKDRSKYELRVACFDEDMHELWAQTVSSPYHATLLAATTIDYLGEHNFGGYYLGANRGQSYEVDDNGNMFIFYRLGKNFVKPDADLIIRAIYDNGTKPVDTKIHYAGKEFPQLGLAFMDDGTVRMSGFYMETSSKKSGVVSATIDAHNGKIQSVGFSEFNSAFVNNYKKLWQYGQAKIKEDGLPNVDLDWLITDEKDGSLMLVGEERWITQSGYYSNSAGADVKLHDVIVIKINAEHKIDWLQVIPKRHNVSYARTYWASYAVQACDNGMTYIIFNDNEDNLPEPDKDKPAKYNHENSVVVLVSIGPDGESTKKLLFRNKDLGVVSVPNLFWQVDDKEMLMVGFLDAAFKSSDNKIGRLTFK